MNEEREKRIAENGTVGTAYATLLNALVDMQASPAYAVRKSVLAEAEQTILALERKANENAEAARKAEETLRPEAGEFICPKCGVRHTCPPTDEERPF